ncbi:hypothetical protein L917_19774 [Phytophthora nicotianae]|uniref:Uncharacterized protein n=2 Tax=Phytophthora nicotianae TaxID=4792 RepID=V9E0G8_PHYNI|nr:hypothetical protein F443_20621 [Phytophthora nicotianae P1569]ETL79618.1 hypothetical protein L917_19774 [Phytophthora nicotianae]
MASGQSVFKGALGWDDWIWWVAIGCVALLILLLLVCCCVCMQRAKRKGHEEAIAAVQARQRLTQERERAEQEQQQRYQQAQQASGSANGYQPPAYGYSKQVTAVPLAPPPNRKNLGPQVAANGYRENSSQLHNQQFAKPYPPLPAQQEAGQAPNQERQYQAPPKWYNAGNAQSRSPLSHGYEANAPRLSSSSFGYDTNYPDSMRYDDPYPTGGGPDGVPFMSVTSPSASKSLKANRKTGVRLGAPNSEQDQIPAPVVVPRYTRAPPSPSEARASAGSGASGDTLQARIDALRSADSNDMVHSRISVSESDGPLNVHRPRALNAQESYASGSARRGLMVGSLLSPNSSAVPASLSSPSGSLASARSYETFDPEAFESAKSTELGAVLTHGSSRSIGSDYSHGQFEDAESFDPDERNFKNNGRNRSTREDNVSFNSRGSVEF